MLGLYVFSLVLGGGFLAFSLLGDGIGGGHHDVGWDGGGVGDASGVDDGFLDGHDLHASKIFSLRMVIYGLFGFGAVGTVLSLAGPGGALALFSALAGGLASAGLIRLAFRYLHRADSGAHVGDDSFVGLAGRVTLPLSRATPGSISVERGNRLIALRALPHATAGGGDVSGWCTVVVVDMADGIARVAPVEEDLTGRS